MSSTAQVGCGGKLCCATERMPPIVREREGEGEKGGFESGTTTSLIWSLLYLLIGTAA